MVLRELVKAIVLFVWHPAKLIKPFEMVLSDDGRIWSGADLVTVGRYLVCVGVAPEDVEAFGYFLIWTHRSNAGVSRPRRATRLAPPVCRSRCCCGRLWRWPQGCAPFPSGRTAV